jgi:hypothetical protein
VLVVETDNILLIVYVRRSRIFTCRILGELTSSSNVVFKVSPAHRDKIEIKCMGSVGGKNTNRTKSLFFSNLRHIEQDKVDVYVFCLNLTWVIGQTMSMNVALNQLGRSNCLTLWKDSYLCILCNDFMIMTINFQRKDVQSFQIIELRL